MRELALYFVLLAAVLASAGDAAACPNCKDTIANTNPQPGAARTSRRPQVGCRGAQPQHLLHARGGHRRRPGQLVVRMIVRETRS